MDNQSSLESDELSKFDIYSKTPPRTKILRKNRQRKQKGKSSPAMASSKVVKATTPLLRRNTADGMYFDDILNNENIEGDEGSKRTSKRQMKLLRGSERDLKLDIVSAQAINTDGINNHQDIEYPRTPSYQIESHKRFMSLVCRTLPCKQKLCEIESKVRFDPLPAIEDEQHDTTKNKCPLPRVEFYETLCCLVRMGCGTSQDRNPRRVMSREETLWQNELKDLIWLELQAYHADRSPMEEDEYLCAARECVEPLLDDIKNYKFQRHVKRYSTENSDSGVEDDCPGCFSIYCMACIEAQNDAFRDIEKLLLRLEDAESLFPSSKAFAEMYPLYSSPEIVGRVKAMCLWYNMTKHQRLKLNILGRLLMVLDSKQGCWAISGDETNTGSPSDSNNSTSSLSDCGLCIKNDLYNIGPLAELLSQVDQSKVSPYRRYIENVLKTRALDKSLNFLRNLHQHILIKTKLTLDFPENEDIFSDVNSCTEEEELRRYGAWSPEAKSLNLPSYRAMFIILSLVPLEVLHEYLLMRLEQKPKNPSSLSIRQLMRELKEGLKVAIKERQRTCSYIKAATWGTENIIKQYKERLESFNKCLKQVFTDFLEYLQQWVIFNKCRFQKDAFEDEYEFCVFVYENVPDVKEMVGSTFALITGTILQKIGERLINRIEEVLSSVAECNQGMSKQNLFSICRELQTLFNEEREMSLKTISFIKTNYKREFTPTKSDKLGESIFAYKCIIPDAIGRVQRLFEHISTANLDEFDKNALNSRIREILMQVYRFGFEFYKELGDSTPAQVRPRLVYSMVEFAKLWMKFVTERCERGRGMRPRWAYQGMEFLLTVCEPANTKHLTEEMFENLKRDMDVCISHVIGTTAPSTPDSGFHSASSRTSLEQIRARSRGSSPSPRPTYKSQRSKGRKTSSEQQSPVTDYLDTVNLNTSLKKEERINNQSLMIRVSPKSHTDQFREAVEFLETELDNKLTKQNLIGKVLHDRTASKNILTKNVTFSWQRGIKIGQGRFGKVYTAVNNNTGDLMAVKEIALQHNDTGSLKRVAEEMKILEGFVHKNLVRSYGVEVHKDEMLIFMEYCSEGTLDNLIAGTEKGLPELLVRRYTFQLLSGVACLHDHGIVHRDIKTANLFLTNGGNCLKIGDFGCAAKIKSSMTMPGELKGFVGTQAYMAPEVFTKNMSDGHGRAADIWSVGCVVVEMTSGQRPWAQYDSNFQIMFKVGMGQSPDPPDDIIDEGLDFLDMCFKHEPKERATARELLDHNFVKVGEDLI